MATQSATPTSFDSASPAASPHASPAASPVEVATGNLIVTLHDENGDPVGGACWQLLRNDDLISEGCDIEGPYGMNGRYEFSNIPMGHYTIVQSLSPDGVALVDSSLEVEIVAGAEDEVIITTMPIADAPSSPVASPAVVTTSSPDSPIVEVASPSASLAVEATVSTDAPTTEVASPSASPVASPSVTLEVIVTGIVVDTGGMALNCRLTPDTAAEVLMTFPVDSQVTILGEEVDGWLPVDCNGQDGWVSSTFVLVEP